MESGEVLAAIILLTFLIYTFLFAVRRIFHGKLLAHPAIVVLTGFIAIFGVKVPYGEPSSSIFVVSALFSMLYFMSFVRVMWSDPKVEKQWVYSAILFLVGTFALTLHGQLLGGEVYHWLWAIFFMFWIILIVIFRYRDPTRYHP